MAINLQVLGSCKSWSCNWHDYRSIIFKRKYSFKSLLWIFDRLTIPTAIGGAFVRIGNFFNSEILGKYTDNDWGVIFENRGKYYLDIQLNYMNHLGI